MSSNLRIKKSGIFTPQLKRNLSQHEALRTASKLTPSLLLQSKQRKISQFQISPSLLSKSRKQDEVETKDNSSQNKESLSNQQQQQILEDIVEINEVFKQLIGQDLKLANKSKQRKIYNHSYQEKEKYGQIWVDQLKEIPKQVFQESEVFIAKNGDQKTNCLRGFIEELALFYYSIENIVLFYDSETIGKDSSFICKVQLQEKSLSALYGIQILNLGKPYFEHKKNVMVFLHPYLAEMYEFDIKNNLQKNRKQLKIKSLLSFPIPQQIPSQLYHSKKGYIYCTDNKGKIYKIDCNKNFDNFDKKELMTKKLRGSAITLLKNSTKYLASSLKAFAFHVKNYTLSFWSNKPIKTWLLFDQDKEIMVVLIKQLTEKDRNGFVNKFMVYEQKSNALLYTFELQQFTGRNDQIMVFNKLHTDCNTKYNFMLLMHSGKRVLLDIHQDRLRKTSSIKSPPLNTNQNYQTSKSNNVISCCLRQDLMGQVVITNHHYLILTNKIDYQTESVNYIRLQPNDSPNIYIRNNQAFGYRKVRILQSEQAMTKAENLPEFTRQVFYKPYQIYYSTDQIVQRIIILRPIDIFYSLFSIFSQNIPTFFKAINKIIPQADYTNLISFCCQVFVDSQGVYLLSRQLQYKVSSGLNNKQKSDWQMIEYKRFKDIDNKQRSKLVQTMIDIAIKAGFTSRQDKEKYVVKGILMYYAKLLKPIYLANINVLSSEICKITIFSLRQLNHLIEHVNKYLKCQGNSYLAKLTNWIKRLEQFITFIKNIPNLPNMSLDDCITQDGSKFHEHLFKFLIRQCRQQIFDQIKKMMPIFVTREFTRTYRLYCEIVSLKDASKILQKCRIYEKLPDYFVEYLVKVKNVPQAVLFKQIKIADIKQPKQNKSTYLTKMNEFYSTRTNLYEKQQILFNASLLLQGQKPSQLNIKEQQQKIKMLMGQLKLQELIIQIYHNRLINKSLWISIISNYLPNIAVKQEEKSIIQRLNTCILDRTFLQKVINQLDHPFLKVMYAYYFNPHSFQTIFFGMAQEILKNHQHSIYELNSAFQQELYFMICKAKLSFTFNQITIVLDTIINLLLKCQQLQQFLSKQEKFVQKRLFWPLFYSAQIGLDIDKLYSWGINKLTQFDKNNKSYTYMALCCCYLVKDFLPKKQQELVNTLKCQEDNHINLKQVYSLIKC